MLLGDWRESGFLFVPLLTALAGLASAQCPQNDGQVTGGLKTYPLASDRYAVQYSINGGASTTAMVYISYYGQTTGSPYANVSGYTAGTTSMSFTSIPALPNASVQLRVTKLFGTPFQASDQVSVRPSVKQIGVTTNSDGTVSISTSTASNFAGEQFILWWNRGADGGGVEGLAFFLNPPYTAPTGNNVKVVKSWNDLINPSSPVNSPPIDTLDFEGQVELENTGKAVYPVPPNIVKIFLGPGAWVQGKFSFSGPATTMIYGPGVLDGSLFDYLRRDCDDDNGTASLSWSPATGNLNLVVDGIIISDHNHQATDPLFNTTLNNMKTISWNSNNDALRFKDSTTATNVFIRSGDDSLMIWGSPVTVINATVWQNYNGGVVNLGWLNNSPGDNGLLDGIYVVKTDWQRPTANDWNALPPTSSGALNGQNNAVFASLMSPPTSFGQVSPPVYRNIFVEDPPLVLFSLKIMPPVNCPATGSACTETTLLQPSQVSLNIENLNSPASLVENSIGFQTLPAGYTTQTNQTFPVAQTFANTYTLTGTIHVNLTNTMLTPPKGVATALTSANASSLGELSTNGANVNIAYPTSAVGNPEITFVGNAEGESLVIAPNTWVEIKGANLAPSSDSRTWQNSDFVGTQMPTQLDKVSATVNGKSAYVYYISPTQVNVLTPPDAISGPANVVLTNGGVATDTFAAQAQSISPSFFTFGGGPYVAAVHTNGAYIGPTTLYPGSTTPAKPGETVEIYANGFGPTSVPVVRGSETQSGTLSPLPAIMVGGIAATVVYAGLVFPGEYQFNVVLPAVGNGDQPISATYNGVSTPSGVFITVHN